jgi:hypothetical protein
MEVLDENYIETQRKKLLSVYLEIVGFDSILSRQYIKYSRIQNEETLIKVLKILPALRTVFQTHEIRSITNRRNDKHLVLNLLRQLLKSRRYKLQSKTFHLRRNGKITSSCKYIIVPMEESVVEPTIPDQDVLNTSLDHE